MTVICALHDSGETWVGSDRAAVANGAYIPGDASKWAVYAGWALGHAGDGRIGDVIEHEKANLLDNLELEDAFALTVRMRELLPKHGIEFKSRSSDEASNTFPASFLLANTAHVWCVGPCLALTPINDGSLYAKGSGGAEAVGAGHALKGLVLAKHRVLAAVEAAIAIDTGCGGDPWVMKLED